jgi:hypothetical protein
VQVDRVEGVAEDEVVTRLGVEERFDAKVIASAEQAARATVPDRKGEVTQQMLHAVLAPRQVRVQDQLRIARSPQIAATSRLELRDEVGTTVDACVRGDPDTAIQSGRLSRLRISRGCEQRMAETNRPIAPDLLGVGAASGQRVGHAPQQRLIDWRAVQADQSGNATHIAISR